MTFILPITKYFIIIFNSLCTTFYIPRHSVPITTIPIHNIVWHLYWKQTFVFTFWIYSSALDWMPHTSNDASTTLYEHIIGEVVFFQFSGRGPLMVFFDWKNFRSYTHTNTCDHMNITITHSHVPNLARYNIIYINLYVLFILYFHTIIIICTSSSL